MTTAVGGSITRRWDLAIVAGPPMVAVAHAAICAVRVQSGMPIAMLVAAASWWNRAVVTTIIIRTGAQASISCIMIPCCSMCRAVLLGMAGRWCCASAATETICARANATIGGI